MLAQFAIGASGEHFEHASAVEQSPRRRPDGPWCSGAEAMPQCGGAAKRPPRKNFNFFQLRNFFFHFAVKILRVKLFHRFFFQSALDFHSGDDSDRFRCSRPWKHHGNTMETFFSLSHEIWNPGPECHPSNKPRAVPQTSLMKR